MVPSICLLVCLCFSGFQHEVPWCNQNEPPCPAMRVAQLSPFPFLICHHLKRKRVVSHITVTITIQMLIISQQKMKLQNRLLNKQMNLKSKIANFALHNVVIYIFRSYLLSAVTTHYRYSPHTYLYNSSAYPTHYGTLNNMKRTEISRLTTDIFRTDKFINF